jgi:hypothetical protein
MIAGDLGDPKRVLHRGEVKLTACHAKSWTGLNPPGYANVVCTPPAPLRSLSYEPENIMSRIHISDHDLERYYLGMVTTEEELAPVEGHILACPSCAERAAIIQDYVDAVRVALLKISD